VSTPAIRRSSVDFPQPECPTSETTSPRGTSRQMSATAAMLPKERLTCSNFRASSSLGRSMLLLRRHWSCLIDIHCLAFVPGGDLEQLGKTCRNECKPQERSAQYPRDPVPSTGKGST